MDEEQKDHVSITVDVKASSNPPKAFLAQCSAITSEGKRCRCNVYDPTQTFCIFHMEKDYKSKSVMSVYYNTLNKNEVEDYVRFMELGDNLEHEIAMTRIFLLRAMKALQDIHQSDDPDADLTVEFVDKGWSDQFGESTTTRKVNKEVLLKKEVRDLLGKLKDLLKTKFEISGDKAEDAMAKAQKVIQAIKDMQKLREDENINNDEDDGKVE